MPARTPPDSALWLRWWRRQARLTQRELANLSLVARASISHVECGTMQPTRKLADALARGLSKHLARGLGKNLGRELTAADVFPSVFGEGAARG